jgi:septal ring factor EnvC (AmiA/AmiB activator)
LCDFYLFVTHTHTHIEGEHALTITLPEATADAARAREELGLQQQLTAALEVQIDATRAQLEDHVQRLKAANAGLNEQRELNTVLRATNSQQRDRLAGLNAQLDVLSKKHGAHAAEAETPKKKTKNEHAENKKNGGTAGSGGLSQREKKKANMTVCDFYVCVYA